MKANIKPRLSYYFIRIMLLLAVIMIVPGLPRAGAAQSPDPTSPTAIADVAAAGTPKVVWIVSSYPAQTKRGLFGMGQKSQPSEGLGSGFFFDDNGDILTNAHVVAGAQSIEVTLKDRETPLPGRLIGFDRDLDVAVIHIDVNTKTPYLRFGNSDQMRVGDWVVAIGNPYGLDHTVTHGIISAKGRPLTAGGGDQNIQFYDDMIQTDAAINPGNSGGPLLNLKGEVIGINTAASAAGQGLGFAIPINNVNEILNELMTRGRIVRAWIGAAMLDVRELDGATRASLGLPDNHGIIIAPLKNSPAAKAGLKVDDVIVALDRQPVAGISDFNKRLRAYKPGDAVQIDFIRKQIRETATVTLEEEPQ